MNLRVPLVLAVTGLACSSSSSGVRNTADAGSGEDAAVRDGATADSPADFGPDAAGPDAAGPDAAGPDAAGPDADAPVANCLTQGCPDASTCWPTPSGPHACVVFAPPPPGGTFDCNPDAGAPGPLGPCCRNDESCTMSKRGRCLGNNVGWCGGPAPPPGSHCDYSGWCLTDQDCTPDATCVPRNFVGGDHAICLRGPCRRNADCTAAPGGVCAVFPGRQCFGSPSIYCRYPSDPCQIEKNGNDCPRDGGTFGFPSCVPSQDGHGTRCILVQLPA